MEGAGVIFSVLSGYAGLTALVPAEKIVNDDALPQNMAANAIQLELVSSTDRNLMNPGATIHVRQRVRIRILAKTAADRTAIRAQVRAALFAGRFPTISGLTNVTVHTDSAGPDGMEPDSSVRIGIQDALITYSEAR